MKRRLPWLMLLCMGMASAGLVAHALFYPFITDDAYISFRYAYNLATEGALVFNPGERVEGYTNFLWTVLLGGFLKLGLRPDLMSRVLGAGFGLLTLWLCLGLGRLYRGGRPTGWEALSPSMLAASTPFVVWCSGGLETMMFTALGTGAVLSYLAEEAGRVRLRLSGLLLALAAMTRPEGLLLFGLTGLHRLGSNLLGERRLLPRRAEVLWLLGFAIPFGLYFLFRLSYYGYPFPNTYYVKAGEAGAGGLTRWGLPYLLDFIRDNALYPLPLLLLVFRPKTTWVPAGSEDKAAADRSARVRPRFVWTYLFLLISVYVAYVVRVGGDFMALGRFFCPILPLLFFFVQEALRECVERPRRDRAPDAWRPLRTALVSAIVVGLLVANSVRLYRQNQKLEYYRWGLDTVAYLQKFADDRILVGTWMRRHLPADTYLAVGGAGAIVYASRMRALDTFGLNDLYVAHNTPNVGDRPGHTKFAPEDYILKQRPDLMCHQARHQDWPYTPDPVEADLWRARGYHWVCIAPNRLSVEEFPPELEEGFTMRPSNYCCLKRMDRALGPFPRVTP